MKPGAARILLYFILFIFYWVCFITPNIHNTNVILLLRKRYSHVLLLFFNHLSYSSICAVIGGLVLCSSLLCHEEVMWPNMCSWLKTRKTDAHLVLLQPASQPRVVLDELLIAQAVLHCGGHVTHPCGCCSARCCSVFSGNNLRRSRELPRAN